MLDITQIQEILPHRYPLLLVDRVTDMDEGKTIFDLPASKAERDLEDWYPILYWLGFPN